MLAESVGLLELGAATVEIACDYGSMLCDCGVVLLLSLLLLQWRRSDCRCRGCFLVSRRLFFVATTTALVFHGGFDGNVCGVCSIGIGRFLMFGGQVFVEQLTIGKDFSTCSQRARKLAAYESAYVIVTKLERV